MEVVPGDQLPSEKQKPTNAPKGIEGRVAYKGSAADIIFKWLEELRSGIGYVRAARLEELREYAVVRAGLEESHPHDVQITKERKLFNFAKI